MYYNPWMSLYKALISYISSYLAWRNSCITPEMLKPPVCVDVSTPVPLCFPAPYEICPEDYAVSMLWRRTPSGELAFNRCPPNATGENTKYISIDESDFFLHCFSNSLWNAHSLLGQEKTDKLWLQLLLWYFNHLNLHKKTFLFSTPSRLWDILGNSYPGKHKAENQH